MQLLNRLTVYSATIVFLASNTFPFAFQSTPPNGKSALIAVSIQMQQEKFSPGQKPWVTLRMKNIAKRHMFPDDFMTDYRLHVEGKQGEPPLTYRHRQLRHEPGLPSLDVSGPPNFPITVRGEKPYKGIPPGGLDVLQFDLAAYYELSPGQYAVYLDVTDKAGVQMRTNTVKFEIQPPINNNPAS